MGTIAQNLRKAIAIIEATPGETINMHYYKQKTECGTLYCVAGHLCGDKYFQDLGFNWVKNEDDEDPWSYTVYINDKPIHDEDAITNELFGEDAWNRLFSPGVEVVNEKEYALTNLRRQLAKYEEQ